MAPPGESKPNVLFLLPAGWNALTCECCDCPYFTTLLYNRDDFAPDAIAYVVSFRPKHGFLAGLPKASSAFNPMTAGAISPSDDIGPAIVASGLLKMCHGSDTEKLLCAGYIGGVTSVDTYLDATGRRQSNMCIAETVDLGEVISVVTKYIETHPEKRNAPSAKIVLDGLTRAYPCE